MCEVGEGEVWWGSERFFESDWEVDVWVAVPPPERPGRAVVMVGQFGIRRSIGVCSFGLL